VITTDDREIASALRLLRRRQVVICLRGSRRIDIDNSNSTPTSKAHNHSHDTSGTGVVRWSSTASAPETRYREARLVARKVSFPPDNRLRMMRLIVEANPRTRYSPGEPTCCAAI